MLKRDGVKREGLKLDDQGLSGGLHELSFPQLDVKQNYTSLELKMCENCPRSFTRTAGSECKYCEACARIKVRTNGGARRDLEERKAGAKVISMFDWKRAVENAAAELKVGSR